MGKFDDIDDNLVIIDSVSKRFSACGARIGCVVTKNKELQQALLKFCQSRLSVATIDQLGAAALYSVDHEFFRQCKEEYRKRIESLITKNTRAIMITNPGNPTGVVLSQEEMRMIADIAKERGLFLICDEVYREFCYEEEAGIPTMAHFRDIDENLVIIDSVSKRFSACGARVGCVVTRNKELQGALLKFCQSRLSVATIDQIGAAALYGVGHQFFRDCKDEYRKRRDTVISHLRQIPGVVVEEPMGAFYVMASLPVDDSDKFQQWLLETFDDNGDTVMFAPGGPMYETPGKGVNEVRIAYVLKSEDLTRAMELLAKGISRYQKEVMHIDSIPACE